MDAIVSSIVTPVIQSLMVPLKKHFGFFISSTKNVKDMEKKMDQLNLIEKDIRDKWEHAIERNHEVPHNVSPWLDNVKETNEKAQNIPKGRIGCFNMAKRYRVGKECYNIVKEMEDLKTRKSEIVFTDTQIPLAEVVSTSTPGGSTLNNIKSRDSVYNAALESLRSNNESQKMIALCGMGGVGKTTMMEQLKKDVEGSKPFDRVVKVVLGETINLFALQKDIAIYLDGKDLTEEDKDARAERLCKRFEEMSKQGKKTLVIMDDLWTTFELKDVGLSPLPNGFKLLLTSRDERICASMGVKINSIFKVGLLNDFEAKLLFFGNVELSDGDVPTLQKIGEDIVKKCGGLPIAIVTIARRLSGNIVEAWQNTLWRLEKDNIEDLEIITRRIFELSYENLEETDKAIFILSALFPDDFNIRTEDMLRFGWGLGFFKKANNLARARSGMKICVSNLIRANLLNESDRIGCVKMHDLVRAFVLHKSLEVKQASITNYDKEQDANGSCDRVLLKCAGMTEFPEHFNYPNLSMLMLMEGYQLRKFPEEVYGRMKKLQVVSYENMHIPLLPVTFEHSTTLRTLCLRSCSFINDDISLLGSLSNLETLSFVDCQIKRLPSTIGKLKKLKLLDLTGCIDLRIDDGVFQNLSRLEELYMRNYACRPIRFTKANCDELHILSNQLSALELVFFENMVKPKNMSFKKLERFRISIGCKLEEMENKKKNLFRNTIQFVGDCNELLECKIIELFNKTEELHLQVNKMDRLENHSFSNLRDLYVSKCRDLTCLFTVDVASGLKNLERLTISKCHVMRTLVAENGSVGVIRFPKLKFMSLTNLREMVSFWDNVIEFPEMVELILNGLSNFTNNHDTSEIQPLLNEKVLMPQLEKLDIHWMKNLKQIWSCDKNNGASKLKKIRVHNCDKLVYLFPSNPLPLLNQLEEVDVTSCDSIEELFNMEFESFYGTGESKLRSITVFHLKKLVNLFPSNPLPLLNQLEELHVIDCGSIEVLFNMEFESFCGTGESKLRSIKVDSLKKLKALWRMKGGCDIHINCFKNVESILIKSCSNFENIFTPTTIKFDLGALTKYVVRYSGEKILKREVLEMDGCISSATYPSSLLHTCCQLQHLELINDGRVKEVVFEMDSHQPPLILPYLQDLNLSFLKEMSHVWKCNWNNKFLHQPLQLPFQNLTNIRLEGCHKIKYLFSPIMAKYLSNLKEVYIRQCDGIEEVISRRDDENENTSSRDQTTTTLLFPHLDTLNLYNLSRLKSIDDESQNEKVIGNYKYLCQYPSKIHIYNCDAVSVIIPWYAVGQMKRLQELEIRACNRMVEVFESESSSNKSTVDERIIGDGTSTLQFKNITTLLHVPQLSNLKSVKIENCNLLSHVFTFSTLESLNQLKQLTIESCKAIQVIVKQENEKSSKDQVVFHRLEKLILYDLPNLKGFFLGMNEFRWPVLDDVMIDDCPQLKMFTHGHSKTPNLKYISTKFGKYSVEYGLNFHGRINEHQNTFPTISNGMPACSFHNLIEINRKFGTTIIPSNMLHQLEKLDKIDLLRYGEVNEVFEVAALEGNESQTVVKIPIPNLREMTLNDVEPLKYLWKSNQWKALEFPNLTTLSIKNCNKLEHVFTCSMVDSLVQLQDLQISCCDNIEVIVKEGDENESDCKVNEITQLPRLKSLQLKDLNSLKGFCLAKIAFSLPALNTLEIKECPALTVFTKEHVSTPKLKVLDTTFGMYYVKPDLNSFIKTKREDGHI